MNDQDEKHVITRARAEQLLGYMMATGTGATSLAAAIDLVNYLRQLPRLQDVVRPPEPSAERKPDRAVEALAALDATTSS